MGLQNAKTVYFTGIGGVSMSGLAEILHTRGYKVSGSDIKASKLTKRLESIGIKVHIGQQYENISKDLDLLVYTTAVKPDNPELMAAADHNIPLMDRATLVGILMKEYGKSISVAGTHGKTTTTSLISEVFLQAGLDPTISVGGVLQSIGGNFRLGGSEYFIVESCEYYDNFLKFYPNTGIILNIERDHTDYFKSMAQLEESFNLFAKNIDKDGVLIINGEVAHLSRITEGLNCKVVTFGTETSDYYAREINYSPLGHPSFDLYYHGEKIMHAALSVPGDHNIKNTLAACAAADFYGIPRDVTAKAVSQFKGADRRFEYKGEFNGIKIIDDYAHHPTEIKTTLEAAGKTGAGRIVCLFQPHTYSRTKEFMAEFAASFDRADILLLLDIYSAREKDDLGIHSKDLARKIAARGKEVHYVGSFSEAQQFILKKCIPNDLLITMGAGDVHLVGENILCTDLSTLSTDF